MDINFSSISDIYNKYLSDAAAKETSSLSKLNGAKDYSKATDDELMDVCKQFEAYFLEQCFKEMSKTVGTDSDFSSASTSTLVDYYKDNLIQNLAEQSTEKEGLGLAQMLYEQMKRNYDL